MERISKNSFDMLKISKERFQDKWAKCLIATLVFLAPFVLTVVIPVIIGFLVGKINTYGIIQGFFAVGGMALFGPLSVGYAKYYRELQAGNSPSLKMIFDVDNYKSKSLFLHIAVGLIMSACYLVGAVFLIVPAFILIAYFSMVFFFMSNHKYMGIGEAMKTCGQNMRGNIGGMYAYKSIFYLMYIIVAIGAVLGYLGLTSYYETNPVIAFLLAVALLLVVFILVSLIVMFNQACNTVYFGEILDYVEKKRAKRKVKETVEATAEVKAEEQTEEKEETPKTEEKKTAKTTTKKTTKKETKE